MTSERGQGSIRSVAVAAVAVTAAGAGFSSFGRSATRHSVVSMRLATEAAFWRRRTNDLHRVDDALREEVTVLVGRGVVAEVVLAFA